MNRDKATMIIKEFAKNNRRGLNDTFLSLLHPSHGGGEERFDKWVEDRISDGYTFIEVIEGLIDEDYLYDMYGESMLNLDMSYSDFFKLNAAAFTMIEDVIARLKESN